MAIKDQVITQKRNDTMNFMREVNQELKNAREDYKREVYHIDNDPIRALDEKFDIERHIDNESTFAPFLYRIETEFDDLMSRKRNGELDIDQQSVRFINRDRTKMIEVYTIKQ